jgi:signal transduction histidine kinase
MDAKLKLDSAIAQAADAITQGRDAVQGLRESTSQGNDIAQALRTLGEELANDSPNRPTAAFHVSVEGEARNLHPMLCGDIYKIAMEAMRNAFRHADAQHVVVEIRFDHEQFRLRVRDDGKGLDPAVLSRQGRQAQRVDAIRRVVAKRLRACRSSLPSLFVVCSHAPSDANAS